MKKMKIVVIGFAVALFSCAVSKQKEYPDSSFIKNERGDITYFVTECDSIPMSRSFGYTQMRFQVTSFSSHSLMYCSPKGNSSVLDTIPMNTELRGKLRIINEKDNWLEIYYNDKLGYVKQEDIAHSSYTFSKTELLVGNTLNNRVGVKAINTKDSFQPDFYEFKAISKDTLGVLAINETTFTPRLALIEGTILIRNRNYIETEKSHQTINEYCLLLGNNSFVSIGSTKSQIETRWSVDDRHELETFYFPIKFKSGKVLLVKEGDVKNIFNESKGELEVLDYPENIDVPIESLIILKIEKSFGKIDEETGEPVFDADGDPIYITELDFVYYHWLHNKLVEVKPEIKKE